MTVVYQGTAEETTAATLADFLASKGVDGATAIVECAGAIHAPGADLRAVPLEPGAAVNVFRVVAGG